MPSEMPMARIYWFLFIFLNVHDIQFVFFLRICDFIQNSFTKERKGERERERERAREGGRENMCLMTII